MIAKADHVHGWLIVRWTAWDTPWLHGRMHATNGVTGVDQMVLAHHLYFKCVNLTLRFRNNMLDRTFDD